MRLLDGAGWGFGDGSQVALGGGSYFLPSVVGVLCGHGDVSRGLLTGLPPQNLR